ncbi:hypothetical protein ANCCAN_23372 [Ancylostoma caninum]|uniref:Uncharacterized protein n=1 Tax=Ancylostoma caninum TaxID=29170 RepID=A0A368FF99_ANCCA|nr:hypothetical protein ANCCAN_23372 [Ancylostoma caninum]
MSGHFADQDDTMSTCSKDLTQDTSNSAELIPAPLPPRQTVSYASVMKNCATSPHAHSQMSSHHFASTPLSVQTDDPSSPPKEDAMQTLHFNYQQEEFLAANLMDFHCLTRECFGRLDLRRRCSPILPSVTSSSACAECLYSVFLGTFFQAMFVSSWWFVL